MKQARPIDCKFKSRIKEHQALKSGLTRSFCGRVRFCRGEFVRRRCDL